MAEGERCWSLMDGNGGYRLTSSLIGLPNVDLLIYLMMQPFPGHLYPRSVHMMVKSDPAVPLYAPFLLSVLFLGQRLTVYLVKGKRTMNLLRNSLRFFCI